MSHHEDHHHESPKRVYFGIPFGFALAFWLIVFFSLKACDGPKENCCKQGGECTKECREKCEAEGKEECASKKECSKEEAVSEEKKESASEEKKDVSAEEKGEKPAEQEKH